MKDLAHIPTLRRDMLIKKENGSLKVYLTKPAQNSLANRQLIELLSGYLKIKKYQIKIIKGEKSKNKVIEIDATVDASKI